MKKTLNHIIVMMMWLFVCHAQASENESRLQGITQPVISETTLHFTYNPVGGPLEKTANIQGVVYTFINYKWQIADVKLTKGSGIWNGEYTIPKDCAFIAFKFLANTDQGVVTDTNNDIGFMYTPITEAQQKIPGSYLAWGTFRNSDFNQQFGNYFKEFSVSQEATELWIKKEIKENTTFFPLFINSYIKIAKLRKPDDYKAFGNKMLHRFLNDFPKLYEPEYLKIKNLFAYTLENKSAADSLETVILQKFPRGIEMRFLEFQKLRTITDSSDKILALNTFLTTFPDDENVPDEQQYIYNKVYSELFRLYFSTKEYNKIEALLPQMNFLSINDSYHHNISKALHFKTVDTKTLLKLSKIMIANMMDKKEDLSYMNGLYWSPNQSTDNAIQQLDAKLKTHIKLLFAEKEYQEALSFFDKLSKDTLYENSNVNELHMSILEVLKRPVLPLLEKAASYNALSPLMIERLKQVYLEEGHEENNFDTYLEKLKTKNKAVNIEILKTEILKTESPKFSVEDAQGNPVTISENKDDIIIIDFWATWCGPCKKAFPGMQMAVDKYKNDPKIRFYFISTMETKEGYQVQAEAYIKKKGYNFNVLFDKKPAADKTNNVTFSKFAAFFNSSGIPRKVIIKNGKIRYSSEGSGVNPLELVDELSAVIDILKSEDI
ncbi:TlpA family protein disulfide reductase [Thalassobellus sediminis]|uniref:TlpA family protein disulfide reductase n=1 Tax=Thalassobellus sediminis TaxID=3367753 RepID=UPI0037AEE1B4